MLMLDPVRKHSIRHNNGIYALGRHVVGQMGKMLLRWPGSFRLGT